MPPAFQSTTLGPLEKNLRALQQADRRHEKLEEGAECEGFSFRTTALGTRTILL